MVFYNPYKFGMFSPVFHRVKDEPSWAQSAPVRHYMNGSVRINIVEIKLLLIRLQNIALNLEIAIRSRRHYNTICTRINIGDLLSEIDRCDGMNI